MTLPGDEAIDAAEAKMAAIFRVIGEQQSHDKKIAAMVALTTMWDSIAEDLAAAARAREELVNTTDDIATLAALGNDRRLEAAAIKYRMASTRFLGKLMLQLEREEQK
jgi:hypothetical protein